MTENDIRHGNACVLRRSQIIAAPLKEVFGFFESPANLALITPSWLKFSIRGGSPAGMAEGVRISYTVRWLGIPLRWTTLITKYEPPRQFVDEQVSGPYTCWRHIHTFREIGGRVEMTDEVRHALPLGILGRIVHGLIVKRQLEAIFDYRAKVVDRLAASGALRSPVANPTKGGL